MAPNVGVNVTCNSSCFQWCPRTLKVACCCCEVSDSDSESESEKEIEKNETHIKVEHVKSIVFNSIECQATETKKQQAIEYECEKKEEASETHE